LADLFLLSHFLQNSLNKKPLLVGTLLLFIMKGPNQGLAKQSRITRHYALRTAEQRQKAERSLRRTDEKLQATDELAGTDCGIESCI
jgi:hypothetical protein